MKQTDLEKLLADMSLKEKVDQMLQLSGAFYLGDENSVLTGPANDMGIGKEDLEMAGSILGAAGADTMKKLQDDYMAKQPHHIPMLFMMDVIHGMKTIFPAPLAQGATFDPELSGECASAAAKEASAAGLHVTFSPMVDLVRDARWGRVVESTGEDPYLNTNSPDFHAHLGYQLVGHFHACAYKFDRWYDMIWMEKCIGTHADTPAPVRFLTDAPDPNAH